MLLLTIKNICGKQVTIRSPVGSLPPGRELTILINVDDLEYLTSDLKRLSNANYLR